MPRVCLMNACPDLATYRGRCASHQLAPSPTSSIIKTGRWKSTRKRILERDRHECHYCGATADTVDHVVAVADGGAPYDEANLVAACRTCNYSRGGKARHELRS